MSSVLEARFKFADRYNDAFLQLRGDIRIPLEQKSATFSQLSGLLGDYLLRSTTSSSSTSSETSSHNLSFVLNTLPKTLSGLDVNINFITGGFSGSETGSSSSTSASSTSKPGELELFKLANVECKHGWLASEDDKKAYEVLLSVANDYDTAVNVLVEGDEIAEGNITGNSVPSQPPSNIISESVGETIPPSTSNMSNAQRLEQLFEGLSMEPNKQAKVYQATIIQRFLQNTGTQLTYAGLFKLSESLQPNSLCALFRNSHFSVLYRRPDELPYDPTAQSAQDNSENNNNVQTGTRTLQLPQATLFQLVTDQALLHEPNAIWESLEDIDGAASTFFDSRLQPAKIRQDWVARNERDPEMVGANDEMHDAE